MPKLTLYSRQDCCLCAEMKAVIDQVAGKIPVEIDEIDIDQSPELRTKFAQEIPLLCIDGRKAFKFRVTPKQLETQLRRHSRRRGYLRWFTERS
ncbi:MAG TPA: glutaredoxin family protein [Candidatus Binatia bacterium]|nr:glutaredoxin family protein [Candidatus Binatia bacterium]